MKRREFIGLGTGALLAGCVREKYEYRSTPEGHLLSWQNDEAVPGWYSLLEIETLFDRAVDGSAAYLWRYGAAEALVRAMAKSHKHVGFDAARFRTDASPTGWASGLYSGNGIAVTFWSRAKGDEVPADAPAWTVYEWGSLRPVPKYDWGYVPPQFPALAHEIGHAIYGPTFEHSWTPPIVNPPSLAALAAEKKIDWNLECVVQT